MAILEKIRKLKAEKDANAARIAKIQKDKEAVRAARREVIYKAMKTALCELAGEMVEGHLVTMIDGIGKLQMLLDGQFCVSFWTGEKLLPCHCEDMVCSCDQWGYYMVVNPECDFRFRNQKVNTFTIETIAECECLDEEKLAGAILRIIEDYDKKD